MKNAYLLQTHFLSPEIIRHYTRIKHSCRDYGDAWLLLQSDSLPGSLDERQPRTHLCTAQDLAALNFTRPSPGLIPGSAHFPLLHFFQAHPGYRYYWLIEYDVRFTGTWRRLFSAFQSQSAALVSAHIRDYDQEPDWPHWALRHPEEDIPLQHRTRSFNPIYRLSRAALSALVGFHARGWVGHHEVLMATLLQRQGFSIADFGGRGPYVPPSRRQRYYDEERTLRYRPLHQHSPYLRHKLYHPVKPDAQPTWKRTPSALFFQVWTDMAYRWLASTG